LRRAQSEGKPVNIDDVRWLNLIDRLKSKLIEPSAAEQALARLMDHDRIVETYGIYEQELRRINALDFNSLIFEGYRLVTTYPAIAARYRRSYPYWLIDEFQDTNTAQYKFVRALAGNDFRNIFAVADDDQIIYEWNGASYSQIQSFLADYSAQALQLPTNCRCPPAIVEAANRLVVYNAQRTSSKEPLIAGKMEVKYPAAEHIQLRACIGQYSFRRSVMGMLQCDLHWYLFRFCSDWITGRERDDVVQRGGDAHLFALSLF
jgi:DNA helicase-2/ATP-dependent DNA helicase PcrA